MRTERALEKLRLALARRGVASTGAALAAVVSSQPLISAPIGLAATLASQAVAAAGAGAVATLTSLMTAKFATTAIYIGISAALSTVFLGVAVYEFNIASSIKASTALIDNQLSKELEQLTELKRAEEEGRRRAVQASQVNKAAATVKANAPATILDAKKEGKREAAKFFSMHPEIRTQQLELEKNGWRKFYRPFLLKANLTAAQFEQLVSIGAENALENAVLTPRGMSGDGSVPPPVDQLRAVLGNNGYMQFEAFEQSHAAYDLVLEMATTANFREPIPPSQLEQIAQIIIANTTKPSTEFNAFGTVEWDKAAAQIKSILTPEQWNAAYTSLLGEAFNRAYAQQQAAQGGK